MNNRALTLAAVAVLSCSSPFEPASRITRLRLLAVSAERSGNVVTLDALAIDPAKRALSFGWAACEPSAPTVAACLAVMHDATIGGPRHSFVPTASYTGVAVAACSGTLTFDGNFRCTGELEVGVKRVLAAQNENPAIAAVTIDDVDWLAVDQIDTQKHRLRVTGGRAEAGENVVVQFYSTDGTFSSEVRTLTSPETTWEPRLRAPGATVTFVIVMRDDRGGVAWTTRELTMR
jgi:hypothetical protein